MSESKKSLKIRLTEREYLVLGYITVSRDCTRREFYEEAFAVFLEQRSAPGFHYRVGPKEGRDVCAFCDRNLVEDVGEQADVDNVSRVAAYYTAIQNHIDRCRDDVVPIQEAQRG